MADRSDIIRKIKKILARAESNNEHEAQLALSKAHELMIEFELSEEEVRSAGECGRSYVFVDAFEGKRRAPSAFYVEAIISEFFLCQIIHVTRFVDGEKRRAVQVFGDENATAIGRYVYVFLTRTFNELWKSCSKRDGLKVSVRDCYYFGIYSSLASALQKDRARSSSGGSENALIRIKNNVEAALDQQLPGLKSVTKKKNTRADPDAFFAGMDDGRNIKIRSPLGNESGTQALLR